MLRLTYYITRHVDCNRDSKLESEIDLIYTKMIVLPLQRAFRKKHLWLYY